MIFSGHVEPVPPRPPPRAFMRREVCRAFDVTVFAMRSRVEAAMTSDAMLKHLFDLIQPDGTFKL